MGTAREVWPSQTSWRWAVRKLATLVCVPPVSEGVPHCAWQSRPGVLLVCPGSPLAVRGLCGPLRSLPASGCLVAVCPALWSPSATLRYSYRPPGLAHATGPQEAGLCPHAISPGVSMLDLCEAVSQLLSRCSCHESPSGLSLHIPATGRPAELLFMRRAPALASQACPRPRAPAVCWPFACFTMLRGISSGISADTCATGGRGVRRAGT